MANHIVNCLRNKPIIIKVPRTKKCSSRDDVNQQNSTFLSVQMWGIYRFDIWLLGQEQKETLRERPEVETKLWTSRDYKCREVGQWWEQQNKEDWVMQHVFYCLLLLKGSGITYAWKCVGTFQFTSCIPSSVRLSQTPSRFLCGYCFLCFHVSSQSLSLR